MRYAVFDLGSNSIKFVVAETRGARVHVVYERSVTTRLAEHLIDTCELRPEAMERTLAVLSELRATATELGVEHFRAVATSAVRDSRNRRAFLKAAREILGFPVRLLSGVEEAETIFSGVTADPHWRGKDIFILDIGGGSAEWVQGRHGKMEKRISLVETVRAQIAHPLAHYHVGARRLVGTGGTITSLVAIEKSLVEFDPRKIDHTSLTIEQIRALLGRFTGRTIDQLRAIHGLHAKRADLIIPGTAVVLATMEHFGVRRLHVSVRGLRYGVLTAAMAEEESGSRARRLQPGKTVLHT